MENSHQYDTYKFWVRLNTTVSHQYENMHHLFRHLLYWAQLMIKFIFI